MLKVKIKDLGFSWQKVTLDLLAFVRSHQQMPALADDAICWQLNLGDSLQVFLKILGSFIFP